MSTASCGLCGATIQWAVRMCDSSRVALEVNTDSSPDAPRFKIVHLGPPLQVRPVPADAVGDYYAEHSFDCPAQGAGRRE